MCNEYFLCIKFFKYCMIVIFTIITSSRASQQTGSSKTYKFGVTEQDI